MRVSSSESNWATLVECECSHHCPNLAHTTAPAVLLTMHHLCSHNCANLARPISPTFLSSLGQLCSHHCTHHCANLAVPLSQPCFPHCAILTLTDAQLLLSSSLQPCFHHQDQSYNEHEFKTNKWTNKKNNKKLHEKQQQKNKKLVLSGWFFYKHQ